MKRRKFGREFKIEAVTVATERGTAVAQAARNLEVARLKAERDILNNAAAFSATHRRPG